MPDLVDRVLAYVDKPWKIAAVAFLALFGVVSYTIWEKRAEIAERILERAVTPRLQPQRFPAIAQQLLDETHADLVILAQINLAAGRFANIDGRRASDPSWRPHPEPRAMFDAVTVEQAAQIIAGQVVCDDVPASDGQRLDVQLGMRRR